MITNPQGKYIHKDEAREIWKELFFDEWEELPRNRKKNSAEKKEFLKKVFAYRDDKDARLSDVVIGRYMNESRVNILLHRHKLEPQ